jgi:hypothetical protein
LHFGFLFLREFVTGRCFVGLFLFKHAVLTNL